MKDYKITDLIPKEASFYLTIPDKTYHLRPCTPSDLINLTKMGLDVDKIILNPISAEVCKIVLYLMKFEDAKEFKAKEVKTINIDTGDEEVSNVGGYNLLLKFISSVKEQMEMFFTLLISMGFDNDSIEKAKNGLYNASLTEIEVDKKKDRTTKKKKALKAS